MEGLYSDQTYEAILERILSRVRPDFDKREGSIIYDASGPMSVELAQIYIALDYFLECAFVDTAPREWLEKLAIERGLAPEPATAAVGIGEFNIDVPIGSRFSLDIYNWIVTEKFSDLKYYLTCETEGTAPNSYTGPIIPIDYIDDLTTATLTGIEIPGEDEEDTEVFRQRVINSFAYQSFGGNQADYKAEIKTIAGVSGVKVFPTWNEDLFPSSLIPPDGTADWIDSLTGVPEDVAAWLNTVFSAAGQKKLTAGGTVRLVVIDTMYSTPSDTLIAAVQEAIDPTDSAGEGVGLAPIGHVVFVEGVKSKTINFKLSGIEYAEGWNWNSVKPNAEAAIDGYLLSLSQAWEDSGNLVVRVGRIESILLDCAGVVDLAGVTINGAAENLTLDADTIPVRGTVTTDE